MSKKTPAALEAVNDTMSDVNGERSALPALCFVVDDEPAIARFVSVALASLGVDSEQFNDAPSMMARLGDHHPGLIFLDISLGTSDAIDVIRGLAERQFAGAVQLMSGRDMALLEDVKRIGVRHGLRMLPVLSKPFRMDAVRRIVRAERMVPVADNGNAPAVKAIGNSGGEPEPERLSLEEALGNDWVEFWYQPKIDLRRGHLMGAEALVRVRHPDRGIVPPSGFLPGASETAMAGLSELALNSALRDGREFSDAGYRLQLAINIPVEALLNLPIPSIVRDYHKGNEPWPGIVLEVTEDQVIRDIHTMHEIATQLRIYEVALSIDDFGRGYSSLARLKELPFAELKLDRSFVDDCGVDPTNQALCRTAVELAHRFGSQAVAEGIEKATDLAAVMRTGCDLAQGFIFAHAMPKEFLLARMKGEGPDGGFARALSETEGGPARPAVGHWRASA